MNCNPFPWGGIFQSARQSLFINIKKIDESILMKHDELITKTPCYGDDKFDFSCNKSIISSTIKFIVSTERFSNSLVQIFSCKQPFLSHNLTWNSTCFLYILGYFKTFNTDT